MPNCIQDAHSCHWPEKRNLISQAALAQGRITHVSYKPRFETTDLKQ